MLRHPLEAHERAFTSGALDQLSGYTIGPNVFEILKGITPKSLFEKGVFRWTEWRFLISTLGFDCKLQISIQNLIKLNQISLGVGKQL